VKDCVETAVIDRVEVTDSVDVTEAVDVRDSVEVTDLVKVMGDRVEVVEVVATVFVVGPPIVLIAPYASPAATTRTTTIKMTTKN
jgi:hypothetical protein